MGVFDGLDYPRGRLGTERLCGAEDRECSWGAADVGCELDDREWDRTAGPYLDDDTSCLVEQAVESLVCLRGASLDDTRAVVSCLASLIAEAQSQLPGAVAAAKADGCTWEQVARRLATTARTAGRRYGGFVRWWATSRAGEA